MTFRPILAPLVLACLLAHVPAARAQFSLAEQAATQGISQDMQGRNARAVTGADAEADAAGAAAPAADSVGMGGTKYIPAYAIVLMLIGLSTFIVCRPSRRHAAD